MQDFIYEPHIFAPDALPMIFHYDILSSSGKVFNAPEGVPLLRYGKQCVYNWHENIELLYIVKGRGLCHLGTVAHEFSENDIVCINSLELHYIEAYGHLEYYCLIPDRRFLSSNGLDTSHLSLEPVVSSNTASALYLRLAELYITASDFRAVKLKLALTELVLYLAEHCSAAAVPADSKSLSRIKLAIGYISTHLDTHITADGAAEAAALSKFHFLREFKKLTGMTLVHFINSMRCEKARTLFSSTELSVAEVCAASGFDNASYFSKTFRASTGMTPSEYRRMCKKNSESR